MRKFAGKYRIPSARRLNWDYTEPGAYFITICTNDREHWFGEIKNKIMGLSDVGCVIHDFWCQIPDHFSHVSLKNFVVMPNHIHGIIIINEYPSVETCESHISTIQQKFSHTLRTTSGIIIQRPKPGSIGSIIGQFKSSSTKCIRKMGYDNFAWQSRFHDRIIRNERKLSAKRRYIKNNVIMWQRDRNNL